MIINDSFLQNQPSENWIHLQCMLQIVSFFRLKRVTLKHFCRIVPSSGTVAMLCYGPCKYLGNIVCEVLFHILQTSLIACATALIIAFYYRYEMLTNNSFTRSGHYKQLVISYCVPLVFLVSWIFLCHNLTKRGKR